MNDVLNYLHTPKETKNDLSVIINEVENKCVYTTGVELNSQSVVVDIGANVGVFSLYASKVLGVRNVIAIEPCLENFASLTINLLEKKAYNVKPYRAAVSFDNSITKLYKSAYSGGHMLFKKSVEGDLSKTEEVLTVNFKTVCELAASPITLLKIDCEGAEGLFFKGYPSLSGIENIALEYHDNVSPLKSDELIDYFVREGFRVNRIPLTGPFGHLLARR